MYGTLHNLYFKLTFTTTIHQKIAKTFGPWREWPCKSECYPNNISKASTNTQDADERARRATVFSTFLSGKKEPKNSVIVF